MKLHVALVAPRVRLPVLGYGGTERVFEWLAKGLTTLGHRVSLVCEQGSETQWGTCVSTIPDTCDVVHFFELGTWSGRPDAHHFDSVFRDFSKPWIYTLHGNGQQGEVFPQNTVFLCADHAKRHGGSVFVMNGVDPDGYTLNEERSNYNVFLGKARWKVKNVKGAIRVAHLCQQPLSILGGWGLNFFSRVTWHGTVNQQKKVGILSRARALIHPVRWHEPFGLAIVEAMMSGAFVVATPYGSQLELIQKEAGVVSTKASVLAEALRSFQVVPKRCRDYAAVRFSHTLMAENYVSLYERVGKGEKLHIKQPRSLSETHPEYLLPWFDS